MGEVFSELMRWSSPRS